MNTVYTGKNEKTLSAMVKRPLAIAILLLAGVVMGACTDSRPPEQIVEERSQQRLDALMKGDIVEALAFATPAYQEMISVNHYNAQMLGARLWTKAITSKVECDQDVCDVVTMVTYKHPKAGFGNTRLLKEKWLKIDGQWWLYQY